MKKYRMNRLFSKQGKCLDVAIDHGFFNEKAFLGSIENICALKPEWRHMDVGYNTAYKTITGSIFEFGFTDAILQMWATVIDELTEPGKDMPFGCITPQETYLQHKILTAALESGKSGKAIQL